MEIQKFVRHIQKVNCCYNGDSIKTKKKKYYFTRDSRQHMVRVGEREIVEIWTVC